MKNIYGANCFRRHFGILSYSIKPEDLQTVQTVMRSLVVQIQCLCLLLSIKKQMSMHMHEMPQSHTTDQPTTP